MSASDPISGLHNRLWENDGTGRFIDMAIERGVATERSQGRGISCGDDFVIKLSLLFAVQSFFEVLNGSQALGIEAPSLKLVFGLTGD